MPAYQSSTQYPEESNAAGHAVDGNTNGDLYDGSCTLTKTYDTNPWWMVDLMEVILVKHIIMFNRQDCCGM